MSPCANEGQRCLIELENVSVRLSGKPILLEVSLKIFAGQHTLIVGKNGSGKSTLIKLMTREIHPYAGVGSVKINGKSRLSQHQARLEIGAVAPHLERKLIHDPKLFDLVLSGAIGTLGVNEFGTPSQESYSHARELTAQFGISELGEMRVSEVSSGELKKAWMARALMPNPKVLVLDEPEVHLDAESVAKLHRDFERLASCGVTLILVTHNYKSDLSPFNRVIELGDHKIQFDGSAADCYSRRHPEEFLDEPTQ